MARKNCLLPFFLAVGLLTAAPDDTAVFKSDVALVRVDAQVLDRGNRAVTGLHAGDFELRDEGRLQAIRNFASEEMPIDVLLLLDVSGSMRPHVERISSAAHQALQVLGADDRVGIMVFDRSTRLRLPFRNSRDDVERALETLLRQEHFNGGTDITRAMLDAAAYVQRSARVEARRAIVILTDDETEFGRDDERVERALVKADAVMSALIAPDAMRYRYPGGNYPNDPYPQRYPRRGGWGSPFPGGGGPLGGVIIGGGGGGGYPGGRFPRGRGRAPARPARPRSLARPVATVCRWMIPTPSKIRFPVCASVMPYISSSLPEPNRARSGISSCGWPARPSAAIPERRSGSGEPTLRLVIRAIP